MTLEQLLTRLLDDSFEITLECHKHGWWREFTCTLERGGKRWRHQSADYPRSAIGAIRGALKKAMVETADQAAIFRSCSDHLDSLGDS